MDITQVDTRIGTENSYEFSNGNTLPLMGTPFGMNYLSIQTNNGNNSWWFNPTDHTFAGFRLTHQPSPWMGDFQHFLFKFKTRSTENFNQLDDYDNKEAIFHPDLVSVNLISQQIKVMATASKFGGAFRIFNYSPQTVQMIAQGEKLNLVKHTKDKVIFKVNNFAECEDPNFTMWVAIKGKGLTFVKNIRQKNEKAILCKLSNQSELIFATSFISNDQAEFNLEQLHGFNQIHQDTIDAWQKVFNKIQVQDHQTNKVNLFYENLYRSFLFPMQFYELTSDKKEVHYSTHLKKIVHGKAFTNVGFWDVYRTNFPLYSILCPDKYTDFLEGFYNNYLESGYLPRWLSPDERGMMPGTMLDVIIADAATKKIALKQMPKYYQAMVKGAETSSKDSKYGREGLEEYKALGYVPDNYPESVNKTLDYSYSDWAISVVAKNLGKEKDYQYYSHRCLNYKNLFNPKYHLMVPKDKNGNFKNDFNDLDWGEGFTEGSAWQNSFNVYQDIPGLINLYGSKDKFIQKLIELVNQSPIYNVGSYGQVIHEMREMSAQPFGQLAISNQPSFHIPYLFALAGKPHYTELLVKQLLSSFNLSFKGYPGDEDNGSMSSWYIWSTLGLYPAASGSGKYIFGIPSFDFVSIKLPNEKRLDLQTENNNLSLQFVTQRKFNGEKCAQCIKHQDLLKGGIIQTKLSLLPKN